MAMMLDALIALLLIVGGATALIGSLGLAKLSDFYKRLHGPAKSTTLGVGSTLVASMLWFGARQMELSVHELLVAIFLALTAPGGAHHPPRAALRRYRRRD